MLFRKWKSPYFTSYYVHLDPMLSEWVNNWCTFELARNESIRSHCEQKNRSFFSYGRMHRDIFPLESVVNAFV